jgi:hypothetical protein
MKFLSEIELDGEGSQPAGPWKKERRSACWPTMGMADGWTAEHGS